MAKSTKSAQFWANLDRKVGKKWEEIRTSDGAGSMVPANVAGRAVLSRIIEDNDNDGPTVRIIGKVISPEEFNGMSVYETHRLSEKGKRTIQMALEMLVADLKRLGAPDIDETTHPSALAEIIAVLNEEKPVFKFNTVASGEYVNLRINGVDGAYDAGEEVEVEEDEEEESDDLQMGDAVTVANPQEDDEWEGNIAGEAYEDDDGNWFIMVADAEGTEWEEPYDCLTLADAEEEGEEEYEEEEGEEEAEEAEEGEEEEEEYEEPAKGETYLYKEGRGKPQQCEVTAVFRQKETVNLKRYSDSKTFRGVSWEKLLVDE